MDAVAYRRAARRVGIGTTEGTAPREIGRRLRYWLNTFRGFATFDVHGVDDRVRL